MKNVTYFFILFLLTLTTPLFADKNSNEEVLKRLDRVIDNKTACHVQKEKEIVDLKQRLHRSKDNREKYELCGSLFNAYLHYHLSGENEYEEVVEQGLEQKLDAMLRHELYAQYKTAPTEEQREQARQEYLDRRGVPESFRW